MVPTLNQVPVGFQNISYTGTAGTSTPVPSYDTNKRFINVRLVASTDCYYLIVANKLPLATTTVATTSVGSLLPLGAIEYLRVPVGAMISVIQSTAGGTLNVTLMQDVTS